MSNSIIKVEWEIPAHAKTELEELIRSTIKSTLSEHTKEILVRPVKLTRRETADRLKISLPTLLSWESRGYIKAQRMGRRVLFPEDEIERCLNCRSSSRVRI